MPKSAVHSLYEQWFAGCGGLDNFLAEYWQRKPLLIRQAIPGFSSPIDANELAGLAMEEYIESRLIIENKEAHCWDLHCGPFESETFRSLPGSHWTLMVQAIDQLLPEVHELLKHFDFLPRWRLDDIMVSYAPDQGSVGPHYDQYDVFLLQGLGKRHWRLGQYCDTNTPMLADSALRIVQDFQATQDWLLEPGDMLYVPPGLAHWGVAEGECMTYSIGFRAPSATEMLEDLATEALTGSDADELMYRDPALNLAMAKGPIDDRFIDAVRTLLVQKLDDRNLLANWFARYMTARKYPDIELEEQGFLSDCDDLEGDAPEDNDFSEADDVEENSYRPGDLGKGQVAENSIFTRHPASRFAALSCEPGEPAKLAVDGELYLCSLFLAISLADNGSLALSQLGDIDSQDKALLDTLLNNGSLLLSA